MAAERAVEPMVFAHLRGNWAPCGQVTLTERNETLLASSFVYGSRYLQRPDALEVDPVALSLVDSGELTGKRLFPPATLPFFGGIRDAAPDAWGRRVIEAKLRVPPNSLPESQYLLHAGSDRVGALDVRTSLSAPPTGGALPVHSLEYLLDAADRIEQGLPIPAQLEGIFAGGSALGGARPKASVRDEAGVLWLAKFPSHRDVLDVPVIEAATLRLAGKAGLNVPPVKVQRLGARRVMLIRRFDRYWAAPDEPLAADLLPLETTPGSGRIEHRSGFVSGLTLLARDELASAESSYGELAAAIRRYCHPSVIRTDNAELFRRMVFNIFVTNDDDHLRNHGFLFDALIRGWCLSPLYDVMPHPRISAERFLHLSVGPQGRVATLENALAACARFTLSPHDAAAILAEVWRAVRQWRTWFDEFGVPAIEQDRVASAFRHIDEISTPATRKLLG